MTFTIALILAALTITMVLFHFLGTYFSLRHLRADPIAPAASSNSPPVSILKPLKGADEGIEENIESFFHIDYPKFELIFSIADDRDPVGAVVNKLIARYPAVVARLMVGAIDIGPNPKVNNMIQSYGAAHHDLILISDSNIRVHPNYLKCAIPDLAPGTGIVSAVVSGQNPIGLGAQLEMTYLNTFYARWMVLAAVFGNPTVLGKSMLFSKTTAERYGGIYSVSQFLAEDYMSGQAMLQLGLDVRVMHNPVRQIIGRFSFKSFWQRHIRWGRMRKAQVPIAFYFEPFSYTIPSALIGAVAAKLWFGFSPALYFFLHVCVFFVSDLLLMRRLRTKFSLFTPVYWLMRESFAIPLWVHTVAGNTVDWRGRQYQIQPGGTIAERSEG